MQKCNMRMFLCFYCFYQFMLIHSCFFLIHSCFFLTHCGLKVGKTILFSNENNADLYTHVNMLPYFLEKPISNHIIIYATVYEYPEATRFSEVMIHIPKKPDASRNENDVSQITKTCWGHHFNVLWVFLVKPTDNKLNNNTNTNMNFKLTMIH